MDEKRRKRSEYNARYYQRNKRAARILDGIIPEVRLKVATHTANAAKFIFVACEIYNVC